MNEWERLWELTKDYATGGTAIDIGVRDIATSNIKLFMDNGFKALLIEPNPRQVTVIEKEILDYPSSFLFPVAIAKENGITKFISSPNAGHSRIPNQTFDRIKWQTQGQKEIRVECWTLEKTFEFYPEFINPFVIDIDCEGFDTEILRQLMKTNVRPMFIMIEDFSDPKIIKEQKELMNGYVLFDRINHSAVWKRVKE